jgi:hypothetical protein
MTEAMMSLNALLEKTPDADMLREMIGLAAERPRHANPRLPRTRRARLQTQRGSQEGDTSTGCRKSSPTACRETLSGPGKGIDPLGSFKKRDPRFARPCAGGCPADRRVREHRQASARPGGGEAPAVGGAGAGRGPWPPAGQGSAWHFGRGDGPAIAAVTVLSPLRAGSGNATRVSPPARDGAL